MIGVWTVASAVIAADDRVAKGTFYFDHSVAADPAAKCEVRTVDGASNASTRGGKLIRAPLSQFSKCVADR